MGFTNDIKLIDHAHTQMAIDQAFRKMIDQLGPEDSLLIYYSGHGNLDRQTKGGGWISSTPKPVTPPRTRTMP
jgi:hypothetical protein